MLALLLVLCPQGVRASQRTEQPSIVAFIDDVNRFAETKKSWRHPESPLALYFLVPLEQGLNEREKQKLARLEEQGRCLEVLDLLIKGFQQLYPALAPAFAQRSLCSKLHVALGTSRLPSSVRCHSRRMLQEALAALPSRPDKPISLSLALSRLRTLPETEGPQRLLAQAWFELGTLAFCHNDRPATTLVLASANRPGGMMLTGAELNYLEAQANGTSKSSRSFETLESSTGYWRDACVEIWKIEQAK